MTEKKEEFLEKKESNDDFIQGNKDAEINVNKNELVIVKPKIEKKNNNYIYLIISIPFITIFFMFILLFFLFIFPINFFLPDGRYFVTYTEPIKLSEMIEIEGHKNPSDTLYATAYVEDTSFSTAEYFYKWLNKNKYDLIVPHYDENITYIDNYDDYLTNETERSINNAIYLSYYLQGYEFPIKNQGALVTYIPSEYESYSPKKSLKTGDYILSVEGNVVTNIDDINELLLKLPKDQENIDLEIVRNNSYYKISHPLVVKKNKLDLNVGLEDYKDAFLPSDVYIDRSYLQGPSAGLMFSLQLISILYGEDLTAGYDIAGTGTIDKEGNVGQIGGIEYKLKGAMLNGVDIFFVPEDIKSDDDNYKKAQEFIKNNETDMKIVPVATVYDAMNYLFTISGKKK